MLADADAQTEKVPTPTGYFWLGSVMPMTGPKQQGPVRVIVVAIIASAAMPDGRPVNMSTCGPERGHGQEHIHVDEGRANAPLVAALP